MLKNKNKINKYLFGVFIVSKFISRNQRKGLQKFDIREQRYVNIVAENISKFIFIFTWVYILFLFPT